MVIGDLLCSNVRRIGDRTAIIFEDKQFTWKQMNDRVNRLANALLGQGLKKGDKVAMLAENSHRYVETYFALAKAGMVAVPLNYQLASREIAYLINNSEARAILVAPEYRGVIESLSSELPSLEYVIEMGDNCPSDFNYEELLEKSDGGEPPVEVLPEDLRAIVYTSGTTGLPKGALITHGQQMAMLANWLIEIDVPREGPSLLTMPLLVGVGSTQCIGPAYAGTGMVILRRFDPKLVCEAIERHKVAHAFLVATMINALCSSPEVEKHDLSSLRLVGYGGSPIAPAVLKRAMSVLKCQFYQSFGMLESGGFVTFLKPKDHEKDELLLSCGQEAIFAEVRIVDDADNQVPTGQVGEMIVKCESHISGYWKLPDKTAETIRNGWVHTGDVGYKDRDGYIYVVDRKKDMIISGGVNIYPAEVEAVLFAHPAVDQAAVIGVPDEYWGEAVKAVIKLKDGMHTTAEEIVEYCRERLGFKKPKSVDFVDYIPISEQGKVLKRELRERYWQGYERRVH